MALEEARRHRELVCKLERERSIEVESLQARWGAPLGLAWPRAAGDGAGLGERGKPPEESCHTAPDASAQTPRAAILLARAPALSGT